MPRCRRRGPENGLDEHELARVVREVAKLTDKPLREIGEALSNHMFDNEASLPEDDYMLGMNVGGTLERLWYTEGFKKRGPEAARALALIKRVLDEEHSTHEEFGRGCKQRNEAGAPRRDIGWGA